MLNIDNNCQYPLLGLGSDKFGGVVIIFHGIQMSAVILFLFMPENFIDIFTNNSIRILVKS